jgi:hypothetical protein
VAVTTVKACVSVDPTPADVAAALAGFAAAALAAAGWRRLGAGVWIDADWTSLDGPTPVAVARVGGDSTLVGAASARVALRVTASRVAPFSPDAALEAAGRL